ncbi:MAG TPA: peptidyl-tRNA hydrolase Pth2 [Conexivisphaerales archaeon]|nr:peptidyl-tRNA hydrolase Pth2 [Conexivisphaerales archaeon]
MEEDFEYKQVMAVRTDVSMGKGKLAAQVAHAAVSASRDAERKKSEWFKAWWAEGQAKIVVKGGGETELDDLRRQAEELGLPTAMVMDRGLTQLAPNTVTCLGIGPGPSELIDRVTGKLKLL